MTDQEGIEKIKGKLGEKDYEVEIPLMNAGKSFTARWNDEGIWVSNLGNQPLLKWAVFRTAIDLMIEKDTARKGARILKGKAVGYTLGSPEFPLDSIEGRVAHKVFEIQPGKNTYRKISAIVGILSWAGICTNRRGYVTFNH